MKQDKKGRKWKGREWEGHRRERKGRECEEKRRRETVGNNNRVTETHER